MANEFGGLAPAEVNANYTGFHAGEYGVNLKSAIEDYLKTEYTEGMRNEFAICDALLNSLSKDTITGKKKYKTFALGITDNIRGLMGLGVASDMYNIGDMEFMRARNTVDAEFDTTKLMGVFSITDEAIMRSESPAALFDILSDSLNSMQLGLKHTMQRYTYGGQDGKIGVLTKVVVQDPKGTPSYLITDNGNHSPGVQGGNRPVQSTVALVEISATNALSILPGMGIMVKFYDADKTKTSVAQGTIFQKVDNDMYTDDTLIVAFDRYNTSDYTTASALAAALGKAINGTEASDGADKSPANATGWVDSTGGATLYARQLVNTGEVAKEYTGLEDIVVAKDNKIFGVDRAFYKTLNCIHGDLKGELLTESYLRDLCDKVCLATPEGANINMVCAKHSIISTLEKQMYQFKQYSIDGGGNGFQLGGRANIKFDNYELRKDKYARDNNVYILDTTKIGELVRRDFQWLTSGRETILERRDGGEIYEAIMNKYADMYIDAWKAHAVIQNVCGELSHKQLYAREVKVTNDTSNPVNTKAVE